MNLDFRGPTAQCWKHFVDAEFDGNKKAALAHFVGVKENGSAMRGWFTFKKGKPYTFPVGENLIRLRFFLDHTGYQVSEVQKLEAPIRDCGRLLAFRIIEIQDIIQALNFKVSNGDPSHVLTVLRGQNGFSAERLKKLKDFVEEFREFLPEKQQKVPSLRYRGQKNTFTTPMQKPIQHTAPAREHKFASKAPNVTDKKDLIEGFAMVVKGLVPFARYLLSEACTPEDRDKLRQLAGGDGVFHLSNALNRLCGEQARTEIPHK